jgi:hypothetical protein
MNNLIIRDPVEKTIEYHSAIIKILPILDEEYKSNKKQTKSYWKRKQELLLERGVFWQSPADLNENIID